jgi:predicted ATPase/DNA-binding SARP family transcriptional activator
MIELRTCGTLALTDGAGHPIASVLAQPKRLGLLVYLAVEGEQGGCSSDRILALFWPDSDDEHARAALRQSVKFLRLALGDDAVIRHGEAVLAVSERVIACDAVACLRALRAQQDDAALALYGGEFLPGFSVAGAAPELEQWLEGVRRRLAAQVASAATRATQCHADAGNLPQALRCARAALEWAPDDETALRNLMRLLLRCGDRSGALAEYERFRARLAQSLQTEPAAETQALMRALRSAAASGARDPSEGPQPLGRDDDLEALEILLFAHRLVTVVGAGGIGKTTVARALAHRVRGAFEDSVCVADLAPVSHPSLVATTVATTLQVNLGHRPALEAIAQTIGSRRILVVLDNCEHVLHAVAELVQGLHRSLPGVRWLATSQEPLKIAGEQTFRLGPLALPDEPSVEAARQSGAVALFEARAKAVDPRFTLTDGNVAMAIDICRQLDGIALAIELAAARVAFLGVAGLRSRLGERFRVLTGGTRLALPRQQTLRAALEWSNGLLSMAQQTVFRRLGVFAGTFSLEAAQQVAADDSIDPWAVLEALGALVDKSLVVAETQQAGEPRYRLLETMRHYALDLLETADDANATRTRHLDVFVALAERAKSESYGDQQARMMQRLDLDLDNLLAAHAWCGHVPSDGGERDLRLVIGLYRYWINRALLSLGHRITQEALDRDGARRSDDLRREALTIAGRLAAQLGLLDLAHRAHDEAIAIARRVGAAPMLADALTWAGCFRVEQGNLAGARAQIGEALEWARQVGSDSEAFGTAALALGELERFEGHWSQAQSLAEASLAIARRKGDQRRIATNLINLVMSATAQRRSDGVRDKLLEAIALGEHVTVVYARVVPLMLCAALAGLQGDWERSARYEGAARCQFIELGWPLDNPADKAYLEAFSAQTRAALGEVAFERAREAGGAMPLDEVFGDMRQYLSQP